MEQQKEKRTIPIMQIIPIGGILISIVFIYLGFTKYGFWDPFKGPRPGFFPIIISVAMLVASVAALVFSFKEENPAWPKENWLLPLCVLVLFATTHVFGMILSLLVFVVLWLRIFEKCTWKTTIVFSVVLMAIVISVFSLWLKIPFPNGIIYDAIFNR